MRGSITKLLVFCVLFYEGLTLRCYKTSYQSEWRTLVPCNHPDDTCIIFDYSENIERDVPTNIQEVFCAGNSDCSVSEMSKIFQGCVSFNTFKQQMKEKIGLNSCVHNVTESINDGSVVSKRCNYSKETSQDLNQSSNSNLSLLLLVFTVSIVIC